MIDAGRGSIINIASLAAERRVTPLPAGAYSAAEALITGQHLLADGEWPVN